MKGEGDMSENEFIKSIIEVASKLKGSAISESEKDRIIKAFNNKSGTAYEKAKLAIEEVLGKKLPEKGLLLEKAASLNNLQNLLAQMNTAANSWQKANKK